MKILCRLVFLSSIGYFLCIGAYKLTLLGVPVDTSAFIMMAKQILDRVLVGNIWVPFPLMETFYSGWALSYIFVFIMLFCGKTLFWYMFFQVVLVAVSLCAMVFVLSRWFNFYVATVVCLLLVADINFVRAARYAGEALEIIIFALFWIALALFMLGLERRRLCFFAAGAFVCGFGCWVKLSFFCYLIPGVLMIVFLPPRIRHVWFGNTVSLKKLLPVVSVFFLLSFSPVIYASIVRDRIGIGRIIQSILLPSRFHDNMDILGNIILRLMHFVFMLRGGMSLDGIIIPFNNLYPLMFLVSAIFLISHMIFSSRPVFPRRAVGLISLFYFCVLLMLCYVPTMTRVDHTILLYPFPEIVFALAVYCSVLCIRPVVVPVTLISLLFGYHLAINIGRGITFFEKIESRLVDGKNCIPSVFAVRQIRGKCRGPLYLPSRLGVYLMDIETVLFNFGQKSPLDAADAFFQSNIRQQEEYSLLVSGSARDQVFKQRILQLSRKTGFIVEECVCIQHQKPECSFQFYNVYHEAWPVSRTTEQSPD